MSDDPNRSSRREFLRAAAATGGALTLGALPFLAGCDNTAPAGRVVDVADPMLDVATAATRNPLRFPTTVSPAGLTLTPAPATLDLGGGQSSPGLAFNGEWPGPTIRTSVGQQASIQLQNGLTDGTIVHWHGLVVPHEADGHPLQEVPSGGSYAYQFPIVQRAGLNWYHPHPHMRTGRQVHQGLAGLFIIDDPAEASLNLPAGPHELPLVIRDARLNALGALEYVDGTSGHPGNVILCNGVRDATVNVDTTRYRLRILNASNTRVLTLALSTGAPMFLIGNDGGLLPSRVSTTSVTVGPAERVDLVVNFSALAVGTKVMLRSNFNNQPFDLLEFVVSRKITPVGQVPPVLSVITPYQRANAVRTRSFSFDGAMRINGQPYDMARIDFQVPFGDLELWRLTNPNPGANVNHPVHIHGAFFQVISRSGGRNAVFPWERGWKDTVLLQPNETVEILIRFDTYRGLYLMHCHRLEHEDMGMMSNFAVV
jgi:FtsP/CotA-like multicopper oxidase with cupredoxin domain